MTRRHGRRILLIVALLAALWPSTAQAQGTIIPFVPQYFTDTNGNPCSGCKLYTYAAGTSTPLATYYTSTLTPGSENANPVIINSGGWPSTGYIYLSATSYKFILTTSADVVIWTRDNQTAIPTTSGDVDITGTAGEALSAGDAVYLSDGSGALTAGRWYKTDSDNTYSSTTAAIVGMAPSAISSGASGSIRIGGRMTGLSGLVVGTDYYVSATAGALTSTAPTNARFVGRAETATILVMAPNPIRVLGTAGGVLYGTGAAFAASAAGTDTKQVLTSGVAGAPTWKGGATLLYSNSGTSTNAAAANVDSIAITGLTAKDRIYIIYAMDSITQTTALPSFYNSTDSVTITTVNGGNNLTVANGLLTGEARIQQAQNAATRVAGLTNDTPIGSAATGTQASGTDATFVTAWTGSWTLALRHGGVTAGGTFRWTWTVYIIAGQ
jgi:hypothetical protein